MAHFQVVLLQIIFADREPTTPFYICTLQMAHVVNDKGKMVSHATFCILVFVFGKFSMNESNSNM